MSPAEAGFFMPAEWTAHAAVWTAWPDHPDWGPALDGARRELAGLLDAIWAEGGGERPKVLVRTEATDIGVPGAMGVVAPYGDSWLRDTGPLFLLDRAGKVGSVAYRFDGWGEKYEMPGDEQVADFVAGVQGGRRFRRAAVLEGGAIDVDGQGSLLTTRQCLLGGNRNRWTEEEAEAELRASLGVETILWLDEGLANDHTDGHVDTLARFVGPGRVFAMRPASPSDPNRAALESILAALGSMRDARGRRLEVITAPSPGAVLGLGGELLPASYANFYVGNRRVVVPTYGADGDEAAVDALGAAFPDREVVGRPARFLLEGGGAFHCVTQQQPEGEPA